MLGVKRNKQLPSIIVAAGDYDYHKYYLLLHMPILELELVENVVKKIGVSS